MPVFASQTPRISDTSAIDVFVRIATHAGAILCCGLVLVAVGQPIVSDDLWWHLALGDAYLAGGPGLERDPLLFTSAGPPPPTSWLADVLLRVVWNHAGFPGLRIFHVGLVATFFLLVWKNLRHVSRSATTASFATALVAVLTAYRLVQLRPHLATLIAAMVLHGLLFRDSRLPSWQKASAAILLMGLWANLHPAYPLGPLLVAATSLGLLSFSFLPALLRLDLAGGSGAPTYTAFRVRAIRLAWIAGMGFVASLVNPLGVKGYLAAFEAGRGGKGLAVVVDEWSRIDLFTWPTASLPPSPMNWVIVWILILTIPAATVWSFRSGWQEMRREGSISPFDHKLADPVLITLAWIGLVATLMATRFAWMAFWPILFLVWTLDRVLRTERALKCASGVLATSSILLVFLFIRFGDWPMVTRGLPRTLAEYRSPYAAGKYHTAAISVLRASGLEGNLFGRYSEGGFQSFWLGPVIRTAMNGSLNMREEAFSAALAIRERIGTPTHPRFEDALDAMGVDLFLGTGLPRIVRPGRPPDYSTTHLENTPGWILVFRNLDSALYLRDNARNARNLERISAYYRRRNIPFDPDRGFDPGLLLHRAPRWAREMGLWTPFLDSPATVSEAAKKGRPGLSPAARLAMGYLALGLYDLAEEANDRLLLGSPGDVAALRRRAWLSLRPDRGVSRRELEQAIAGLSGISRPGRLTLGLRELLQRRWLGQSIPDRWSRTVPVFTRSEARALLRGRAAPWLESGEAPPADFDSEE